MEYKYKYIWINRNIWNTNTNTFEWSNRKKLFFRSRHIVSKIEIQVHRLLNRNTNTYQWTINKRLLRWISCMLNCFLSLQGGLCSPSSIMYHPWLWWSQYVWWLFSKKIWKFEMKVIMMLVRNCINCCAYLYTLRSIENQPR